MSVGLTPTKEQIDNTIGVLSRQLNVAMTQLQGFKFWLDQFDSSAIQGFGYSPTEAALLASAASDLDQLRRIYQGVEALAEAKDFRAFSKRIFGFGIAQ